MVMIENIYSVRPDIKLEREEIFDFLVEQESLGKCLIYRIGGQIICAVGIDEIFNMDIFFGVANIWFVATSYITENMEQRYKIVQEAINKIVSQNDIRRLQAYVRNNNSLGHLLLDHLGFKVEGIAKAYYPDGCNAIIYAKVIKNG